jgi:riboflavin kinase/FMN adenylyltransferase
MKTFFSLSSYVSGVNTVTTIGAFDGVHLGHVKLLNALFEKAKQINGESLLVTFEPHPKHVLYPDAPPLYLLQTLAEKQKRLSLLGIDKLLVIPFTQEFSRISSEQFIKEILVDALKIKAIIIGYDHRFGKNRAGGLEDIQKGGRQYNFSVEKIDALKLNETIVSSARIRAALQKGDITLANQFLGYYYELTGQVMQGAQVGRTLGFPTANLRVSHPYKLLPAIGVYAVWVVYQEHRFPGMCNIGYKPTVFSPNFSPSLSVEVHILDFSGDLYGAELQLEFVARLREEIKFNSLTELQAQLERDKEETRKILNMVRG